MAWYCKTIDFQGLHGHLQSRLWLNFVVIHTQNPVKTRKTPLMSNFKTAKGLLARPLLEPKCCPDFKSVSTRGLLPPDHIENRLQRLLVFIDP